MITKGPTPIEGVDQYEVMWSGPTTRFTMVPADQLVHHTRDDGAWAARDELLAEFALQKLAYHQFTDVLYSIGSSRTQFLVYQYQPVLKFVQDQPRGLLLADEVGLGKTIEAGLILKELLARGPVRRVLVVCPANLRQKWRSEMRRRFGFEFSELRTADLRSMAAQFATDGTWPDFMAVGSIEGLRAPAARAAIQETGVSFDLVIVDEAHHMRNPTTESFALGEVLADQSDHILLLSATPVQTGIGDLLSLLKLAEPSEFRGTTLDDLDTRLEPNAHLNAALAELAAREPSRARVRQQLERLFETQLARAFRESPTLSACLTALDDESSISPDGVIQLRRDIQRLHSLAPYYVRTRKREVQEGAERRAVQVAVALSAPEREFYKAWVEFLTARAKWRNPHLPPTWAVIQRERQAASCIPSAAARVDELVNDEDLIDDLDASDPELWDLLGADFESSTRHLDELRVRLIDAAAQLPETDTKLQYLIGALERLVAEHPHRKILIFTFFKGTLAHIYDGLTARGVRCYRISGDVPRIRALRSSKSLSGTQMHGFCSARRSEPRASTSSSATR